MTEPIRGKVARILDERRIALNLGSANGVSVGMHFDVVDAKGVNIEDPDPDTGEVLGSINIPIVRGKVTQAHEKLSVATTFQSEKVNVGGTGTAMTIGPLARPLMPASWVTKYETLEKTEHSPPFDEKDSKVKPGDPVVQVLDVEEPEQKETNKD